MPQDMKTGSAYNTKVPSVVDAADIVAAFTNYHYGVTTGSAPEDDNANAGIVGLIKNRAPSASPTFTGKVIVDGYIQGPTSSINTIFWQPGAVAINNSTASLQASDLLTGMLVVNLTSNKTLTLPSGTDLDSAVSTAIGSANLTNGISFRWHIARTNNGFGLSLNTSTGHGIIAPGATPFSNWQDSPASFLTRKTGSNTWVTYWLG